LDKFKDDMKICIVKLSAMGDIIHAMCALQFIKDKYPACTIDWIVESGFKDVLEGNPHIDNILPINLKSIKKKKLEIFNQIKILKSYGKNNYDIVIDAQGLLKSAIVSKIVASSNSNKSKIIGFDKNSTREGISSWLYDEKVNIAYSKNVILRNLKVICESIDIIVDENKILMKKPFLFSSSKIYADKKNYVVFVVGASKINKIYPKDKFKELASLIDRNIIVVWGNEEEYKVAQYLYDNCKNVTIAPKGNLEDLKSIIKNSKLVIGADTGPTHMAWGLNIPSVTIFGNTPAYRNTYITNINKVIKSHTNVDPLKLDKNDFSIKNIDVKDIYHIVKRLLF
jgi:heptosyltransferase-1